MMIEGPESEVVTLKGLPAGIETGVIVVNKGTMTGKVETMVGIMTEIVVMAVIVKEIGNAPAVMTQEVGVGLGPAPGIALGIMVVIMTGAGGTTESDTRY